MDEHKLKVAKAALDYIEDNVVVGVGTGSTVNYFIDALASIKHRIDACVASSVATEKRLRALGISVIDLNVADEVPIYIDGADEVDAKRQMIKGGGGALAREKIVATVASQFICIVEARKVVNALGQFAIAVEVLPIARSFVAREIVKLGGDPQYRESCITDNGNCILDVFNLPLDKPCQLEDTINSIPGVVENGLFAKRLADLVLVGDHQGVTSF